MGAVHSCAGKGISATETILTLLPSGQGIRAASSTAAMLDSEPSTANKIFISFLIDFNVVLLRNALQPFQGNARAARKSLPGIAEFDCGGKNYEAQSGKIRKAVKLDEA